ncbi:ogr/Delta-like zinc finger family protein [Larsenimonas rhizosphaerae]|uniref:ogr/Delta-like zinc finger family protein n=1 Tax=Larsenimonas rhizosphaerae TaxID=2944682 RepID=UPI0020338E6B|nr:ogr/Delta-like zinc finger family protein [Larsenimonas rhizosphaerae]MCM2131439.1 ogr/Delta-like zinc finger family protein [Larsenimonas rhizosphaerae]
MNSNPLGLKCMKCKGDLRIRHCQAENPMAQKMYLECQNSPCGQLYSGVAVIYPEGDEQNGSRARDRWKCPCCDSWCRIRTSKKPAPSLRIVYLECRQESCGWRGKGECLDGEPPRITGGLQ